jgi:putative endonuclease
VGRKIQVRGLKRKTGILGEDLAEKYLQEKGYVIVQKNFRTRFGEIDIIAISPDKKFLCFVEVKTRKQILFGEPIEAVDEKKARKIFSVAEEFLSSHHRIQDLEVKNLDIRFDVISVEITHDDIKIEHIENAF